jgi:tape measure domain-containing protein
VANDLRVKLSTDISSFSAGLRKASQDVESTVKQMKAQFGGLETLGSKLNSIGFAGLAGITAPIVAAGVAITKVRGDIDSLERGLVAITGSSDEAARQFARLREVAKLPGLGLEEAARASINLQAVGFSANDAERNLKAFGNALALVGRGKADLEEVVRQLGQLANRGKVTADNLKPILERVPQVASIIKKEFGTIDTEVLQKMGVSSQQFISVLLQGLEKLPTATGGIKNAAENASDAMKVALSDMGRNLEPVIVKFYDFGSAAAENVSKAAKSFSDLRPATQDAILGITAVAAGIPAAILALGKLVEIGVKVKASAAIIVAAFAGAKGAVAAFGSIVAAVFGGPVALAVAALGTLGAAAYQMGRLRQANQEAAGSANYMEAAAKNLAASMLPLPKRAEEIASDFGIMAAAQREAAAAARSSAEAHKVMSGRLQEVVTYQEMLNEALGSIGKQNVAAVINATAEAMTAVADIGPAAIAAVQGFADALARAGVDGEKAAAQIKQFEAGLRIIERVKSGQYRIEAGDLISVDYSKLQLPPIDTRPDILAVPGDTAVRAAREIDKLRKIWRKQTDGIASDTRRSFSEVSTVVTDLSRDLAKLAFDGGKFGDVMKGVAKSTGEALFRYLFQQALQPIGKALDGIIASIPGLNKLFGAVASSAGPAAASAGASAAGSAGSAGAAASAGLTGIVGAVAGVASAISGIVGNFQMKGMNKSLDLIEHETRYSQIHLLNILEKLNAHLPGIDDIHLRLQELRQFGIGVWPQPGYNWAPAGGGNATSITIQGQFYGGPSGLDQLADAIAERLRLRGVIPKS